jgi:hypothetical protein
VPSDKPGDELRIDAFEIDLMFAHSQVVVQILLVDATKRAQEIAGRGPQAFDGIGVDFAEAIAVVIARPFLLPMTHRGVDPIEMIVPLPFIRVTSGVFLGVAVHVFLPCLPIRVLPHPQPTLATFPADSPHDGRTIILIGAVASSLVGAAARRVARIAVFVAFFPPRSGTSHRFLSRDPATAGNLKCGIRWLGGVSATDGRTGARGRVPQLTSLRGRLGKRHGLTTPHGAVPNCCRRTGFPYRGYRCADSGSSDNRQSRVYVGETRGRVRGFRRNRDSAILGGESVSPPRRYWRGHRGVRLSEKSCLPFTTRSTD